MKFSRIFQRKDPAETITFEVTTVIGLITKTKRVTIPAGETRWSQVIPLLGEIGFLEKPERQ